MAIGVPTPPRRVRQNLPERRRYAPRGVNNDDDDVVVVFARQSNIECAADGGAKYEDALKVGDNWQGDDGLACCCHVPGGPNSQSSGTAEASISDNIQCPADPSGSKPPPQTCPLNCNEMRSYVYAIATKCKTDDGTTGGTANLLAGQQIKVYHS
ncbi:hypothetical protein AAE478_009513 [Parahypoxylon ruwenzoriense]